MFVECRAGRTFMGRIEQGEDLLLFLNRFCENRRIALGHLDVIGAVQEARLGWYDQQKQQYTPPLHFTGGHEILSCRGTISLMNTLPQVHAHIQLSGADGSTCGGHLYEGTTIYNAEFIIHEQIGAPLVRSMDRQLNAPVWFAEEDEKRQAQ